MDSDGLQNVKKIKAQNHSSKEEAIPKLRPLLIYFGEKRWLFDN